VTRKFIYHNLKTGIIFNSLLVLGVIWMLYIKKFRMEISLKMENNYLILNSMMDIILYNRFKYRINRKLYAYYLLIIQSSLICYDCVINYSRLKSI
jgi:hypothetical protein